MVPITVIKLAKIGNMSIGLLSLQMNSHLFPMCVIFLHCPRKATRIVLLVKKTTETWRTEKIKTKSNNNMQGTMTKEKIQTRKMGFPEGDASTDPRNCEFHVKKQHKG